MTEIEYVLKEVSESRENAEYALCYGVMDTMEKVHNMRGFIRALREIEVFINNYEARKRED
jgi:hypothetical protein